MHAEFGAHALHQDTTTKHNPKDTTNLLFFPSFDKNFNQRSGRITEVALQIGQLNLLDDYEVFQ